VIKPEKEYKIYHIAYTYSSLISLTNISEQTNYWWMKEYKGMRNDQAHLRYGNLVWETNIECGTYWGRTTLRKNTRSISLTSIFTLTRLSL